MMWNKRSQVFAIGVLSLAVTVVAANLVQAEQSITLPDRTAIQVRLDQTVASDTNRSGDRFDARIDRPIVVDSATVIPEGALVKGRVVYARKAGRLRGRARLQLALASVEVDGRTYELQTSATYRRGGNHDRRNFAFIGGGAGGGMLLGAIAGGAKGALIGGPIGAGAGIAFAYFTANKNIRLPAETLLDFELARPLSIESKS
jgi:hypothetical protein